MTTLTLKNIPDDVHERLRERAVRHHRSLNSEVIACLRAVLMSERVDPDALLAVARRLREGIGGRLTDKVLAELKSAGRR